MKYDATMVRFIHTADWQLGMTRHFLDDDAQARFSEARIEAIRGIGRLATEESCAFVVVCGDVFETNHVERRVIVRALDAMTETPDVTFYLLPGNHDPLNASSVFRSATFLEHRPDNVVVLDEAGVVATGHGARLIAAPWTNKAPLVDLVHRAIDGVPPAEDVTIVVGHGAVDSLSPDDTNPALIVLNDLIASIESGEVHYVALGDRHSTTKVEGSERIWYSGAPEPTAYREIDPGNVLVVEVSHDGLDVTPHRTARWWFHTIEAELVGPQDVGRLETALSDVEDKSMSIVQLVLVGQISLADKVRLDAILEHFSDLFASLNTWERHSDLVVLPNDQDFASLQLSGFAGDALDELVERAQGDGAESTAATDALGLLYRLVGRAS